MSLEQPFRTDLAGIDTDIVVLRDAVRSWSKRPFQPPLTPLEIRVLGERAAATALENAGARAGERWRVIVSESVVARRIDETPDARGGPDRGDDDPETIRGAKPASSPAAADAPDSRASAAGDAAWRSVVERFQRSNAWRASWQIVDSVGGYVLLWVLIYWSQTVSWWLTVPLAALAGGFLIRVFIIFHDCGHRSFFGSRTANTFWGWVTGLLTMMPFPHWRGDHAIHHGTTGDLDRRGVGDVWTMTVREYIESTRWKRLAYRLARSPFVMFLVAPLVMMTVLQRFPRKGAGYRERQSVWITNGAVALMVTGMILLFGLVPYVVIQLIVHLVAGSAGVWLFYVQHQYEDAYWERTEDWDYTTAALKGSSYFRLPRVLQWFSGNIGFHHIHHLSPRIPNYYLEDCHRSDPLFETVEPIGLLTGLRTLGLRLWDETSRKLVGWGHLKNLRAAARAT